MLFNDSPVDTRLRRAVAAAFTLAATRQLRELVAELAIEALLHRSGTLELDETDCRGAR